MTDLDLLHQYANSRSETAFSELVQRYTNLVYSICIRSLSDRHLAEEATQAVFLILSKKAHQLSGKVVLSGWLFRTARLVCANAYRLRQRRQKYEAEAGKMYDQELISSESNEWKDLAPVLDQALASLGEEDRCAILLRYFENKNYSEIGSQLNLSEDAIRKRTVRALEKLKKIILRKGLVLSVATLTTLLSTSAAQAAPVGMAAEIAGVVSLSGSGALKTAASEILAKSILTHMKWIPIKLAAAAAVITLSLAGTALTMRDLHSKDAAPPSQVVAVPIDTKKTEQTLSQTIQARRSLTSTKSAPIKSDYTLQDLGTLGGKTSVAHEINNIGDVVGGSDTDQGNSHAFLWREGEMIDITPDAVDSCAYGINDQGQVVGEMMTSHGQTHAFLWSNGVLKDLGTLGGNKSTAYSINNFGQIVGTASTAKGILHAFLWEQNRMMDLTPSHQESCANDINNLSEIVGSAMDGEGVPYGFYWKRGQLQVLSSPSRIYSISSVGKYIGIALGTKTVKSFVNESGSLIDLAPSHFKVSANGINENGEIVGTIADERDLVYLKETHEDWERGFIFWWKNHQLKTLVTNGKYRLYGAGGINNQGQIIGRGAFENQYTSAHAILLTPSK